MPPTATTAARHPARSAVLLTVLLTAPAAPYPTMRSAMRGAASPGAHPLPTSLIGASAAPRPSRGRSRATRGDHQRHWRPLGRGRSGATRGDLRRAAPLIVLGGGPLQRELGVGAV